MTFNTVLSHSSQNSLSNKNVIFALILWFPLIGTFLGVTFQLMHFLSLSLIIVQRDFLIIRLLLGHIKVKVESRFNEIKMMSNHR